MSPEEIEAGAGAMAERLRPLVRSGWLKRKLFELGCWFYEPMVPRRLMYDRIERLQRAYERDMARVVEEHRTELTNLRGELSRALAPKQPDPPRQKTWWPCGAPF